MRRQEAEEPKFIWKFPSVVALGLGVGPWKTLRQSPEGAGGGHWVSLKVNGPETQACSAHRGVPGARPWSETLLRTSLQAGGRGAWGLPCLLWLHSQGEVPLRPRGGGHAARP